MTEPIALYLLACLGGVVAGITNTLAGSGSLITLPLLVMLGLPIHDANGTNRVGIVVQNIVALTTLKRGGALNLTGSTGMVIAVVIGAIAGAFVAVEIDERTMNFVVGVIMVSMLFVLLFNPKRWLEEKLEEPRATPLLYIAFVGIGFYGGFIQAGVGVLLLIALVLGVGYDAVRANGIKLLLALVFTAAALIVFVWNDQVDWALGALMAVGQAIGAFVAARFASDSESAAVWIRRLLVVVTVAASVRFFWMAFIG